MITDALKAVTKTVGGLYPTYPIYVDNVNRKSDTPFFYLDITPSIDRGMNDRVNIDLLFNLTYKSGYHDTSVLIDFLGVAENIQENLENFTVNTKVYKAYEYEVNTDNKSLNFYITLHGFRQREAETLIEEIDLTI